MAALFYRYKSVGGFDYVADFLIGSRTKVPLATRPGDSGAVWVLDLDDEPPAPVAVQWGGTVLGEAQTTFALASNLSTIARELNVDVYRGPLPRLADLRRADRLHPRARRRQHRRRRGRARALHRRRRAAAAQLHLHAR